MNQTTSYWWLWHRNVGKIDMRGLRKVILTTMFVMVTFIYLGQLAESRILPAGVRFGATPVTTLLAISVGAVYLWRMRIPHSIEMTILAIFGAHWLELGILPTLYEWDGSERGIAWTILGYASYTTILAITYIASYLLFTTWRARYRYKLIVAGVLIVLTIISQMMQLHS